jgi:EmrB/QacA subfamily drug resistance transporter
MKSVIKENKELTAVETSSASSPSLPTNVPDPRRWKALALLSLAQFVVILDTSIIGIALPTIQQHFGFSQTDLQWVFNAYVIVFGASLLLGGRLSDIIGHSKIFVIGFIILTMASVLAGLAASGLILIVARALQGIGAALIAPSALSMVMNLFSQSKLEMNKAMGIWGAAAPAGGTAGVFLGGVITAWLDWPWVFLINVPIGIAVLALVRVTLPTGIKKQQKGSIDYLGSLFITGALVILVYAIVMANDIGWMSIQTISLMSIALITFGTFLAIQRRKKDPLIPLQIFKTRNILSANIVMALLGAAWIPMWFFLNLYLQQITGYGPFESGLALLPMTVTIMVLMIWIMPRLIKRFGSKHNMVVGLASLAIAIILFSGLPASNHASNNQILTSYVLPVSLVAALGMSLAYIPVLTAAVSNARKEETGLAQGL